MKRLVCLYALLAPVLAFACPTDDIKFSHGYVRAMAPGQHVTAVYMDIENTGDKAVSIVKVSSPDAPEVQMHTNIEEDGKVRMQQVDAFEIAPKSTTHLQPGGNHIMLMDLKEPLTDKSKPVTLVFEYNDGSKMTVHSIPVKDMRKAE